MNEVLQVAWWRWENWIQHKKLEIELNITLSGKRRGKEGSEHGVEVEKKKTEVRSLRVDNRFSSFEAYGNSDLCSWKFGLNTSWLFPDEF